MDENLVDKDGNPQNLFLQTLNSHQGNYYLKKWLDSDKTKFGNPLKILNANYN